MLKQIIYLMKISTKILNKLIDCVSINGEEEVLKALEDTNNKNVTNYKTKIAIESCKICNTNLAAIRNNNKSENDNKRNAISIIVYCFKTVLKLNNTDIAIFLTKSNRTITWYSSLIKRLDEKNKLDIELLNKMKQIETKIYKEINNK